MESRTEIATAKFMEGYNCAQAVIYSFCDDLTLDKNAALKIACGFGGGMGRKEEVCGAVSAGIIVLGNQYGRGEKDDRAVTEAMYKKTREFMDSFAEKHGTFICRNLLASCKLTTDEGQKQARQKELMDKVCKPCIRSAVEIVESMIKA
jgi:C_GCAxxG_C_C family probable redox protein